MQVIISLKLDTVVSLRYVSVDVVNRDEVSEFSFTTDSDIKTEMQKRYLSDHRLWEKNQDLYVKHWITCCCRPSKVSSFIDIC